MKNSLVSTDKDNGEGGGVGAADVVSCYVYIAERVVP